MTEKQIVWYILLTEVKIDSDTQSVTSLSVELYSKELGYIDIHPFVLNADGTSKQADLDGGWYEFQPDYFGTAVFEGRSIPCISAKGQQVFHSGYDLREKDIHDLSIIKQCITTMSLTIR